MSDKRDMLDEYLAGEDGLSSAYDKLDKTSPPPALDRAILKAAHEAAAPAPARPARWNPFATTWAAPVAVASVFVLTVGVVFMFGAEVGYEDITNDVAMERLANEDPDKLGGDAADSARAVGLAPAQAPDPLEVRTARPGPPPVGAASEQAREQPRARRAPAAGKPATPTAPARKQAAPQSPPEAKVVQSEVSDKPSARGRAESAAPAAADAALPPEVRSERASPEPIAEEAPVAAATALPKKPLPPKEWLVKIRKLRKAGKHKEAEKELAAFKKAYPDYPLGDLAPKK